MLRALLIDDEASARRDLTVMLAAHPEVVIVGEAATVKTARARLAADDYDVVFLDVQLVGGTGFDLAAEVRPGARIIFVTAHNQYALRAFEVNALDYLLKPVPAGRLASAIARLGSAHEPVESRELFQAGDLVHLQTGQRSRFAQLEELAAIESQENYTLTHLVDGTRLLVRRSLKSWGQILPPEVFLRVHRTTIVNVKHVIGFQREATKSIRLQLRGLAGFLPVSREYWAELKTRLPGNTFDD